MAGRKTLTEIFRVAREPSLTPLEKVVWLLIRSYDSGHGCWAGDGLLGEHLGRSGRTVERAKASLLEKGYLTRTLRGPNPAKWRAVVPDEVPTDVSMQTTDTDDEASPQGSPRASPSDSPLVSPEYVEYGESTSVFKDSKTGIGGSLKNGYTERVQSRDSPISPEVLRRAYRLCPECGEYMPPYREACEQCRTSATSRDAPIPDSRPEVAAQRREPTSGGGR